MKSLHFGKQTEGQDGGGSELILSWVQHVEVPPRPTGFWHVQLNWTVYWRQSGKWVIMNIWRFVSDRQVGGLASENVRWADAVENFRKQERTLCGDVLLISAFVSYLGYFTKPYRAQLLDNSWRPFLSQLQVPDLGSDVFFRCSKKTQQPHYDDKTVTVDLEQKSPSCPWKHPGRHWSMLIESFSLLYSSL